MDATCSVRMVQPLMRLATGNELVRDLVPEQVAALDPDARIPLREAHAVLSVASERLRDDTLGLKLGRLMSFGTGGTFDYAVRSASTVRESLEVAARYSRLIANPFAVTLERWKRYAVIRFDDEVPWSPHIADFGLSAWYTAHVADELPQAARAEYWLPHAAPADTSEYHRTFKGGTLRFNAPFLGVVFEREYEEAPMPVSDPVLHSIICARADSLLASVADSRVTLRVRRLIAEMIRAGSEPSALGVARMLRMSRRTLSRRLDQESTSFSEELDKTRREIGLSLVQKTKVPLVEVAFQLGFSHVESFNRAFKRWTGTTPLVYRASPAR
jgi:AraC-like DNA-binding protein